MSNDKHKEHKQNSVPQESRKVFTRDHDTGIRADGPKKPNKPPEDIVKLQTKNEKK